MSVISAAEVVDGRWRRRKGGWCIVAHHAPWITEFHTRPTRSDGDGTYYGTQVSQAQQVDLVANVCSALLTAATTKARFYGAGTDELDALTEGSMSFFLALADTLLGMGDGVREHRVGQPPRLAAWADSASTSWLIRPPAPRP